LLPFILSLLLTSFSFAAHPVDPTADLRPRLALRDSHSLIWFATDDALLRFDGHFLMQQDSWDNWQGGAPEVMATAPDGRLWAFLQGELFVRDERFSTVDLHSPILQGRGQALAFHQKAVYLATEKGLLRYSEDMGERVLLSGLSVTSLLTRKDGGLLCGTREHGLYRFDAQGNPESTGDKAKSLLPSIAGFAELSPEKHVILGRDAASKALVALWHTTSSEPALFTSLGRIDFANPLRILDTPEGALIQTTRGWTQIMDHGRPTQIMQAQALRPEQLAPWLPELLSILPPPPLAGGHFQKAYDDVGVLVERQGEVVIAWQADASKGPAGLHQIQVASANDQTWTLFASLASGDSTKVSQRILMSESQGYREWKLPDEVLKGQRILSLCPVQIDDGSMRLLLGLPQSILLLGEDGARVLSEVVGANCLEPLAQGPVLVAGEHGVALLEGEKLQRLAIRESVYRVIEDGYGGLLACAKDYILHLNSLNEVDTLVYPEALRSFDSAGSQVRQILASGQGRFWLLSDAGLYYYSGPESAWTQPMRRHLQSISTDQPGAAVFSMLFDSEQRLWLSTLDGSGWIAKDRHAPTAVFAEDPRTMDSGSPDRTLRLGAVDPLNPTQDLRWRIRLDDSPWSSWKTGFEFALNEILPEGLAVGSHRLQLQAVDAWGNFSSPVYLPLHHTHFEDRLPFMKRLLLLLAMVGLSVLATIFWPKRGGFVFSLLAGSTTGVWVFISTDEPLLYWALPVIMVVASRLTTDQVRLHRESREEAKNEASNPLLDLVDLFREFGHSGLATRNLDRLLRSSRNLYIDDEPEPEINVRFQEARAVFVDLTMTQLLAIRKAFGRLSAEDRPITPIEQELFADQVNEVASLLKSMGNPPRQDKLEELAFHLDRLEKTLSELEHRVDLQISSSPLKVLDLVLLARSDSIAGLAMSIDCPRDLRQVLVRLPVDRLQFILDNLVDNAAYWMRKADPAELRIELRERPRHLQLRLSDTGPGIAEKDQERIFHAGVTERSEHASGVGGYGLFRSREILARFGGQLLLEKSELGKGSTFLLEVKKVEPEGSF
jgi:signal transduction histidine kinase